LTSVISSAEENKHVKANYQKKFQRMGKILSAGQDSSFSLKGNGQ